MPRISASNTGVAGFGIAALVATVVVAGCTNGQAAPSGAISAPISPVASSQSYYKLVQYPQAGFGGIHAQTVAAKKSIDMEMYELADTTEESDLAAAAKRHVKVRVLLDAAFSGKGVNQSAYTYLAAHGVSVKWAPTGYIFHIKATTFDAKTSDVSTANLTSKYYATTRDAEIIDTNPTQVKAIEKTFSNDWAAGSSGKPSANTAQASGLVWSPNTGSGSAETALVNQIKAAKHSVHFESEELSDAPVYDALAADAKRGVSCEIVMTNSSEWDTAFTYDTKAGCHVHVYPDSAKALYIHEKLILDDAGTTDESLLIGSQNASKTSLTKNRELGLLLSYSHASTVINAVAKTFASDYAGAAAWGAKPGSPTTSPSSSHPAACTPLTNSGNCYKPGELCRSSDHGKTGIDGDGQPIECVDNDGWRWELI